MNETTNIDYGDTDFLDADGERVYLDTGEEFKKRWDGTYWTHHPVNAERLLNVAKALRESKQPEAFSMHTYVAGTPADNECGTPACAFGHYASRTDLQSVFALYPGSSMVRYTATKYGTGFTDGTVGLHFGVTRSELRMLFDSDGCGNAQTVEEAAQYIEAFVELRQEWDALAYEEREKYGSFRRWAELFGGLPDFSEDDSDDD